MGLKTVQLQDIAKQFRLYTYGTVTTSAPGLAGWLPKTYPNMGVALKLVAGMLARAQAAGIETEVGDWCAAFEAVSPCGGYRASLAFQFTPGEPFDREAHGYHSAWGPLYKHPVDVEITRYTNNMAHGQESRIMTPRNLKQHQLFGEDYYVQDATEVLSEIHRAWRWFRRAARSLPREET